MGCKKRYTERKQEWEAENKEILQKENELEIQKQTAMVEDFQIAYEALQEKNRKREELQKLLETLEQKLDARIKKSGKRRGHHSGAKSPTDRSFLSAKASRRKAAGNQRKNFRKSSNRRKYFRKIKRNRIVYCCLRETIRNFKSSF